ncbi:hypothetical protein TNCV_342951 [Trichonephila clavipes]|nr:hypothetical protein TNCV_342951 [Trichonephila clavipes]
MASLGHQSLPTTNLGRVDKEMVSPEDVVTAGTEEDIDGCETYTNGCSNFEGGHTIFVMVSSVWVVDVIVEGLATCASLPEVFSAVEGMLG